MRHTLVEKIERSGKSLKILLLYGTFTDQMAAVSDDIFGKPATGNIRI